MKMAGSRAYTRPTPVPKMPTGLVELMEGMTKEVLKCNPTNVYEFCTTHMQKLLEIRDGLTGKRVLSLEQKISRAQDKIKLRAHERQQIYDKHMQRMCKIDHKYKELSLQTIKTSVTREMCLINVEEIEIAHCQNNKVIESNIDGISSTKEGSRSDDENINIIMNESENGTVLNITITEPIKDKHINVVVTEHIDASQNIETPKLNNHSDVLEKPLETFEEKIESILEKNTVIESSTPVVTALEENGKLTGGVETSTVGLESELDFTKKSLNHDKVNANEENSDATETKKDMENSTPIIKDYLFDDVTSKNPINTASVSEDNTVYRNGVVENTNTNLTENDNNLNVTVKNIHIDIQTPLSYAGDKGVTNNVMSSPSIVSTLNETASELRPLGKETVTNTEQDNKTNDETEVGHTNDKPLCSDISSTIDNSFENATDSVPNDNCGTNTMDLETAAITIQKVFRLFLFKSRASNDEISSMDEDVKEANGYPTPNLSNDRRPLGITRMDTMLQTVNEEKSLSLSTDDSSTLSSAATIIQAHIRGFLVRNKLNSNKTASTNSILNSDETVTSLNESEPNEIQHNKNVLNIHIIPDGNVPSLSRDESIVTSTELSLDGSPPSSINLHPLGYDKSEPRKQLKREDAFQSISPPSNNSVKLSEDVDSTKEILSNSANADYCSNENLTSDNDHADKFTIVSDVPIVRDILNESFDNNSEVGITDPKIDVKNKRNSLIKMSSDEMDVVTPFTQGENECVPESKLIHSGELHDVVLPTNVTRGSTSVVRGE